MSQALMIERPEIFQAAAASGQNQEVYPWQAVALFNGRNQFLGRTGPLDSRGHHDQFGHWPALADDPDHVAHGGAGGAGDDGNSRWVPGQPPFASRVEQPFGFQLGHELAERQVERTQAGRLQSADYKLVLTAGLVNRKFAPGPDRKSIFHVEDELLGGTAPEHGLDLRT